MAKGSLGPILEAGLKDFARRGRSEPSLDKSSSVRSGPSRLSLLPSVKLPSLRRQHGGEGTPTHDKTPLLTLKLSSRSFLDSVVTDDASKNTVYTFQTVGATTTIVRSIADSNQFASIRWPKVPPTSYKGKEVSDGVHIHIGNARWNGGETLLLKHGAATESSRKFSVPNYSHPLKWKRHGNVYWCTTASVKGPIATLELARDKTPTKLFVFETLHDKQDSRGVLSYQGVYILLLDYLLVTATLLVTDLQEWMLVKKHEGKSIIVPNPLGGAGTTVETTTTDSQWRKILYGEPIFPKLSTGSSTNVSRLSDSDSTRSPSTPASSQHPNFIYGSSVYPSLARAGESVVSVSTNSEYEGDIDEDLTETRPPSPSAESTFYPVGSGSAPTHGYVDPSYYKNDVPPIPHLPLQYSRSNQNFRQLPPSPSSSHSRALRELPLPPSPLSQPSSSAMATKHPPFTNNHSHPPAETTRSTTANPSLILNRARSMTTRAAPRPLPSLPSISSSLRRSRSHATLADEASVSRAPPPPPPVLSSPLVVSPRSQRSLPQTPASNGATSPAQDAALQEELRAAAVAARVLRQQTITIPSPSPPSKNYEEEEDLAQWVQLLTSPTSGRHLPALPFSTPLFDIPPPSYNSITFNHKHAHSSEA